MININFKNGIYNTFLNSTFYHSDNCYPINIINIDNTEKNIINQTQINIDIQNNSLIYFDEVIKKVQKDIINNEINIKPIDNGEDFILSFGRMTYTITMTTTENQKTK